MDFQIFNEDCIEGMKRIADNSVDMILTDLPYNLTACKWDKDAIDLPAMWEQFKRILKPQCSAVLFASGKFTFKLVASNFEQFKYKWIWVKNAPTMFVHAKNAPMRKYEEICIFSDGVISHPTVTKIRMKYNPQGVVPCEKIKSDKGKAKPSQLRDTQWRKEIRGALKKFGSTIGKRKCQVDCYVQDQTNYPTDILYFKVKASTKKFHPTEKPTDLLEYLIRTYTDEGETVLDATMGSGSTGVAAINTGRNFIGFELEKKFFDIAQKRITDARNDKLQRLF